MELPHTRYLFPWTRVKHLEDSTKSCHLPLEQSDIFPNCECSSVEASESLNSYCYSYNNSFRDNIVLFPNLSSLFKLLYTLPQLVSDLWRNDRALAREMPACYSYGQSFCLIFISYSVSRAGQDGNHKYVSPWGTEQSQALVSRKLGGSEGEVMDQEEGFAGERGDDSAREKESVDAFVFPEWWPHCAPHIFDVSFYAGQSMMLGWGWRTRDQHWLSRPTLVSTPWEPESMLILPAYEAL